MDIEIGTRVNNYWCGDGVVTGIGVEGNNDYFQIEWDSGLSNETITGYHRSILRVLVGK